MSSRPKSVDGGGHHGLHLGVDGQIGGDGQALRPVASTRAHRLVDGARRALGIGRRVDRAAHATSQPASASATAVAAPTPPAGPGHQGHLPVEIVHRPPPPTGLVGRVRTETRSSTAVAAHLHPAMNAGGPNSMYVRNVMNQAVGTQAAPRPTREGTPDDTEPRRPAARPRRAAGIRPSRRAAGRPTCRTPAGPCSTRGPRARSPSQRFRRPPAPRRWSNGPA